MHEKLDTVMFKIELGAKRSCVADQVSTLSGVNAVIDQN
jgi:hypothetical protein